MSRFSVTLLLASLAALLGTINLHNGLQLSYGHAFETTAGIIAIVMLCGATNRN